ncbi:hypothetical protein NL676_034636 [Syzygium grande]|nr:hypothetical protein NL676_034636 [Syzygium grande]
MGTRSSDQLPELMDLQGKPPSEKQFEILIRMHADANRGLRLYYVYEKMKKFGVKPRVFLYDKIIDGLARTDHLDLALSVYDDFRDDGLVEDPVTFMILIKGLCGKVKSACGLLKDLIDSGYRADLRIYNSLIEDLCNVKQVDKVHKLFFKTLQEDLQPDFGTVNPILVSYAEMRRVEDLSKLLMQMEKDLKVKGYCSVSIYNILMGALKKSGDVKLVSSLFDEMKNTQIEPDSLTYSIAIECLVAIGEIKEACTCYNKIMGMCSLPTVDAYRALAKGLSKIGEIDASMMLVRDCLANITSGPMEFKYSLTILHESKSGQAEKVVEVLDEMVQEGFPPINVAYSAVISGLCKDGTIEEARKVFSSMQERELLKESDVIVYDGMLVEHMQKKTADLVLSGLKFFGKASMKCKAGSGSSRLHIVQLPYDSNLLLRVDLRLISAAIAPSLKGLVGRLPYMHML